jgi:hypothetical protein
LIGAHRAWLEISKRFRAFFRLLHNAREHLEQLMKGKSQSSEMTDCIDVEKNSIEVIKMVELKYFKEIKTSQSVQHLKLLTNFVVLLPLSSTPVVNGN